VVFGDIGTSPLYTFRECVKALPEGGGDAAVLGVLSILFWTLLLVVVVKYLWFITRADNGGEGGIFALLALSTGKTSPAARITPWIIFVLGGAALLYGDGVITPAVSVLGAMEGLVAVNEDLSRYVVPASVVILLGLFMLQKHGTKLLGNLFGPVMLIWFVAIGVLGACEIVKHPQILKALNPIYGFRLLMDGNLHIAGLLGAVVLAFTGAEALYADLGHFGRRAIMKAWYFVAMPGLLLSYFGQGAWALAHLGDTTNPFFALAPDGWMRSVLTGLSVTAAIIASQALITGTYSLTRQAVQLGFLPRLTVKHTSEDHEGQIYIPIVNTLLAIATIWVVVAFGSSERLTSAYGIAVTGTMGVTTVAFWVVLRKRGCSAFWTTPLCCCFLVVDVVLFGANLTKIQHGGWLPIALGAVVLIIMHTWRTGRSEIVRLVYSNEVTEAELVTLLTSKNLIRVRGSAVFMAGSPRGTPLVLLHHIKAGRCLHQDVAILSVITEPVPYVAESDRVQVFEIGGGVWRVVSHYGYLESPDAGAVLEAARASGVTVRPDQATYYFNHEMVVSGGGARMWEWQKALYGLLSRNSKPARDYFRIPPGQIVELGLPIQL
jgi:KUP system potassium uptake protein